MSVSVDGDYSTWSWADLMDQYCMYVDMPRERARTPHDFAQLERELDKRRREGRTPAGGKP